MTTAPLQPIDLTGGLEPTAPAAAQSTQTVDLSGGLEPLSAPLTEKDAGSSQFATQQASEQTQSLPEKNPSHVRFQASDGTVHDVPAQQLVKAKQIDPTLKVLETPDEDTGVVAGVKRNTVGLITGLYHAFTDPATDQEKTELLQKVRDLNQRENAQIPEDLATNPKRGTLVLHRILDAPADVLQKKGNDETQIAKDLINHHEYWKGGNMYLSGLTDKALSAVPIVGPAINATAERAESGDVTGAATDVGSMLALENAPKLLKAGGKAVEVASDLAGRAANKINTTELRPEQLTKRPETPAAQHGTPVTVESPLDGPTVGRQLGGKDLSAEALQTLQGHIGDTIPVGGSAKNSLFSAVEPVSKAISDGVSKMNAAVKDAPAFTTSIAQDNGLGEGTLNSELEAMKKRLPASDRVKLSADVDDVLQDADKALSSTDPVEVLEQRRLIGRQIDWDKVERNPSTPQEVANASRARVYRALGEKLHDEIPSTVELDKALQPNLELMSHMKSKLGERVVDDPHAATVEHQSELKKGKATIENAAHNDVVAKNWTRVKTALITAGIGGGIIREIEHLIE